MYIYLMHAKILSWYVSSMSCWIEKRCGKLSPLHFPLRHFLYSHFGWHHFRWPHFRWRHCSHSRILLKCASDPTWHTTNIPWQYLGMHKINIHLNVYGCYCCSGVNVYDCCCCYSGVTVYGCCCCCCRCSRVNVYSCYCSGVSIYGCCCCLV
jgi:hypothetical protein